MIYSWFPVVTVVLSLSLWQQRDTSDNQNVTYKEIKMNRIELTMSGLKYGERLDFGEGDNIPDGAQFGRKTAQNNTLTMCHIMCSYVYKEVFKRI